MSTENLTCFQLLTPPFWFKGSTPVRAMRRAALRFAMSRAAPRLDGGAGAAIALGTYAAMRGAELYVIVQDFNNPYDVPKLQQDKVQQDKVQALEELLHRARTREEERRKVQAAQEEKRRKVHASKIQGLEKRLQRARTQAEKTSTEAAATTTATAQ